MKDAATPTRVQSVSRACRLLKAAAGRPDGLGATDAAAQIGTAVPTAHHLLNTLAAEGLLAKAPSRRFVLGPAVAVLADAWLGLAELPDFLVAPLHRLAVETGETAYLTAWRPEGIRVLGSVAGEGAIRVAEAPRGAYPMAHARASGKLLLAHAEPGRRALVLGTGGPLEAATPATITDRAALDRELAAIRERGWAEDHEEFAEGVSCLSAPALRDGALLAAFTVSAPTERFNRRSADLLEAVRRAARAAAEPSLVTNPPAEVA